MARKVFISILGTGPYSECTYSVDNAPIMTTRYIQLATFKHILSELNQKNDIWNDSDKAYIFMTSKAHDCQWIKGNSKDNHGNYTVLDGLKELSEKFNYPFHPIEIANGEDNEQIWTIFQTIFNCIEEKDILYFDITHAFRYQPMLLLVLINYAKFLKNISVKTISYGNFMADSDMKPIMDLTSLSVLQDWTFAAGQYLRGGNVDQLVELCNNEVKPILAATNGKDSDARVLGSFIKHLTDVIEERRTCRGIDIIKSTSFKKLKYDSERIENTFIEPFNPLLEKIKESLLSFDENESLSNGWSAAVWCFKNGMYQQSTTILQELVVSFFCIRHEIRIDDERDRTLINKSFNIIANKRGPSEWDIPNDKIEKVKELLKDELMNNASLISCFTKLSEVRNDFNHSGMRSEKSPMKPPKIKKIIEECISDIGTILFDMAFGNDQK